MLRRYLSSFLIIFSSQLFSLDLELTQGTNSALPMSISSFGHSEQGAMLAKVISKDLTSSGRFKLIAGPKDSSSNSSIKILQKMGADNVIKGHLTSIGNNRFEVSFDLIDAVAQGRVLISRSFQVESPSLRALAHHISDIIYQKLTGERGVFSTKIAYILVEKKAKKRQFSLEIADIDGHNPHALLVSSEPIMSPAWSPNGKSIAYVSFESKKAQIYTVNVATGQRRLITDYPGINGAPAWSPDGKKLAVVLSKTGTPKIYLIDMVQRRMEQLTHGSSIDTEPSFAPDGRSIIFTSNRGGSPQIYQYNLMNKKINRITFDGRYNARASFSPDEKEIVMLHRVQDKYNIGIQELGNNSISRLTFDRQDESPSFSPNGRLILYATKKNDKGVLAIVSQDARIRMRLPARNGDVQEPAWSPFLG